MVTCQKVLVNLPFLLIWTAICDRESGYEFREFSDYEIIHCIISYFIQQFVSPFITVIIIKEKYCCKTLRLSWKCLYCLRIFFLRTYLYF